MEGCNQEPGQHARRPKNCPPNAISGKYSYKVPFGRGESPASSWCHLLRQSWSQLVNR